MTTEVETLNRWDAALIPLLAAGMSQAAAAHEAGCSTRTVERRMADPDFRLTVIEAARDMRDRLLAQSINGANIATTYLVKVVVGEEHANPVHVRAAIALRSGLIGADRLDQ